MRVWPEIVLTAGITMAVHAQHDVKVSVPFVGCSSFGQAVRLEAPQGIYKSVSINPGSVGAFAYYESADGISLLAPRGWFCQGASGSGGATLLLSPSPILPTAFGSEDVNGPAIELTRISGENSGRYQIAEILARVFPAYRSVSIRVLKDFDFAVPAGPFPQDALKYKGKRIVEYTTPARMEGLGNFNSWLKKSDTPIAGAAILIGDPANLSLEGDQPEVLLLAVRLPSDLVSLTPAIIRYVEQDAVARNFRPRWSQ